jgi:heat shock protein HslJ
MLKRKKAEYAEDLGFMGRMVMRTGVLLMVAALFSCATVTDAQNLAQVADSGEWALAAISGGGKAVSIDRAQLGEFSDAFTLRIAKTGDGHEDRYIFSGRAAPNRFTMPVKVEENGELTVSPPAATLMAALREPDVLKEKEYLQYLASTRSVTLSGERLVLDTADEDGQKVSLTFAPLVPASQSAL